VPADSLMPDMGAVSTKLGTVPNRVGGAATEKESTGANRSLASVRRDVHIAAAAPSSLVIPTVTPQKAKRIKGREGYDCPSASDPQPQPNYDDMVPSDILHVLGIAPDHTIDQGFIIPGVPTDPGASIESLKNTAIATIDYKFIGNPFKRDPTRDGAASLFLPSQLFGLIEGLYPDWTGRSNGESETCDELWKRYSKRTVTEAASARWREQTIVEKKKGKDVKVWTKGSLQFKEQNDHDFSQVGNCTCLFPGTPTDALKAWWGRPYATRGEDATTQQGMSTTDMGGVVSSGA
jgi:hypothetical protein